MAKTRVLFKKLICWEYFPLLLTYVGLLVLHGFILLNVGDDSYFSQALNDKDLFSYLFLRFQGWTSRLIIEVATVGFAYHPLLFKLVNPLFFVLLIYSMDQLIPGTKNRSSLWVLIGLCALLPKEIFNGTGWVATNVNYLWPVALGLYSLRLIPKLLKGQKLKGIEILLTLMALLYASNHELMMAALLAVYGLSFVWLLIKRHFEPVLFAGNLIILGNLWLFLNAPGNLARFTSEVSSWFPMYEELSFFQKCFAGFSSTMFEFVMEMNYIFLLFGLLLFLRSLFSKNSLFVRAVSAIPVVAVVLFGFVGSALPSSPFGMIRSMVHVDGNTITRAYFDGYGPAVLYLLVIVAIAFSLISLLKDWKLSFPLLCGFALGLVIRLMMSISPTVWGSGTRTFLLLYCTLSIATAFLARDVWERIQGEEKPIDAPLS